MSVISNETSVNISETCLVYIMPFQAKNSAGVADDYNWSKWVRADNLLPLSATKTLKSRGNASLRKLRSSRINDIYNNNPSYSSGDLICITMGDPLTKVSETVSKLNKSSIIWWGLIEDEGSGSVGFNNENGDNFNDFEVKALEIGALLDRLKVDNLFGWKYLAVNSTRGFDQLDSTLSNPPPINLKKDSDIKGNCVAFTASDGTELGVFYDSEDVKVDGNKAGSPVLWKKRWILEHLFRYSVCLTGNIPKIITSTINSTARLLEDIDKSIDLFSITYAGALDLILPEAEWWWWYIDIDETSWYLRVKNGADETPVDVELDSFTESVVVTPVNTYDGVRVVGDWCYFTFTVTHSFAKSYNLASMDRVWESSDVESWKVLTDEQRADNVWDFVFRQFRLKSREDGGIQLYKDIGLFDSNKDPILDVPFYAVPNITYRGDLAIKVDYSGYNLPDNYSSPVMNAVMIEKGRNKNTGAMFAGESSEYRDIGVYYITRDSSTNEDLSKPDDKDLSGMSVKVLEGKAGVEIRMANQSTLGLNVVEIGDEVIDWRDLYVTITCRSPQRVGCYYYKSSVNQNFPSGRIVSDLAVYGSGCIARNILTVYDDELKFNAVAKGTIIGAGEDYVDKWLAEGNFGTGSKFWYAFRNDFDKCAEKVESLKNWACVDRNVVRFKRFGELDTLSLGTYINNVKEKMLVKDGNGDDQFKELLVKTFVSSVSFNFTDGSETVETSHISMPELGSMSLGRAKTIDWGVQEKKTNGYYNYVQKHVPRVPYGTDDLEDGSETRRVLANADRVIGLPSSSVDVNTLPEANLTKSGLLKSPVKRYRDSSKEEGGNKMQSLLREEDIAREEENKRQKQLIK